MLAADHAARQAGLHIGMPATKAQALVKDVLVTPRSPQIKETLFTVREPDTNLVARLTLMQREFEGSNLRAVACPASVAVAAPVTLPATTIK